MFTEVVLKVVVHHDSLSTTLFKMIDATRTVETAIASSRAGRVSALEVRIRFIGGASQPRGKGRGRRR